MKDYLMQKINNCQKGLFICRLPTGYGKSYAIEEAIREVLDDPYDKRRIIFLTSQKKNLPQGLFDRDDVLVLRSNIDQMTEVLVNIEVPENFRSDAYKRTLSLSWKLCTLRKKDIRDKDYIKTIEKELAKSESEFRREIRLHLKNAFPNKRERLNAIRTLNRYHWIGELYPSVFTEEKRVIIMTMKKFLGKNSVVIDRSYDFLTSDIAENAIIFIDEFDATKAVMTDHIIERALSVLNDFLSLFRGIKSGLRVEHMSSDMRTSLDDAGQLREKLDSLIAEGDELTEKFRLDLSYKMAEESTDRRQNFLFNDGCYHTILAPGRQYIRSYFDTTENRVTIVSESKEDYTVNSSEDDIIIFSMLRDVRGFISRFRNIVNNWAESYRNLINTMRGDNFDEMVTEDAVSSILNKIGLNRSQQGLLMNESCHIYSERTLIPDMSGYTEGFEIFDFEDSDEHNESTDIKYIKVYDTPEKIMQYLCKRNTVFGVSATADMPTVIGNYDLEYLKEVLGNLYHGQDKALEDRVRAVMNSKYHPYEEGRITLHTEVLVSPSSSEMKKAFEAFLSPANAALAVNMITNRTEKEFAAQRYENILRVMCGFFEHSSISALLCLQNALPSDKDEMNENLLKDLFKLAASDKGAQIDSEEFCVLRTVNFDNDKKHILKALSEGKRRFVMSSYSTIGAGQNLQYEVKDKNGFIEIVPCADSDDKRHCAADFDALYLGNITNLTVNTYSNDTISKEELMKILFHTESLYHNGEMNYHKKEKTIKLAFNCFSSHTDNTLNPIYDTESLRNNAVLLAIQALGRMCRTHLKKPDIYLFADSQLLGKMNAPLMRKQIMSPELSALTEACEKLGKVYTPAEDRTLNKAERISTQGMRTIRRMLSQNWDEQSMQLWNSLRDTVLRYPTADEQLREYNEVIHKLYITLGEATDRYIYSQYSDFTDVTISADNDPIFFKNSPRAKLKGDGTERIVLKMNSEDSGLCDLMKYDPLKKYFLEMGYAVAFEKKEYLMSPVLYHNIYKGALGEAAGRFILENERGIVLSPIDDPRKFEFFDYILAPDIYVDFKNWKYTYIQSKEKTRAQILKKLDEVGGKRAYIINMSNTHGSTPCVSHGGRIIEIPRLIDENGNIDRRMLDMIKEDDI